MMKAQAISYAEIQLTFFNPVMSSESRTITAVIVTQGKNADFYTIGFLQDTIIINGASFAAILAIALWVIPT